jgi:hypothetical protein
MSATPADLDDRYGLVFQLLTRPDTLTVRGRAVTAEWLGATLQWILDDAPVTPGGFVAPLLEDLRDDPGLLTLAGRVFIEDEARRMIDEHFQRKLGES